MKLGMSLNICFAHIKYVYILKNALKKGAANEIIIFVDRMTISKAVNLFGFVLFDRIGLLY